MPALRTTGLICHHCLLPVNERDQVIGEDASDDKVFCCRACYSIYRMIREEGLEDFYQKRDWKDHGIPASIKEMQSNDCDLTEVDQGSPLPHVNENGEVREAELMINGIRCASCIWLIEKIVERTNGVVSIRINFATHQAHIGWVGAKTNLARIVDRIRSIGYAASPFTPAARETALNEQNRDLLIRLGTAVFFSMQLMLPSLGLYAGYFQGIDAHTRSMLEMAAGLACTPVLLYSGWPFLRGAYFALRNKTLSMDVLITMGSWSAFLLSIEHMRSGKEVYFDTAAMIITLVLLGKFLENTAKQKASQTVSRLLMLQPTTARIVRNEDRFLVNAADIRRGELIEVRPGERMPMDGIIRKGRTEVDESLVTGESQPREKTAGSGVVAGSMNGLGTIVVEVTRVGEETILAQIARLVEHAQTASAPIQRIADRV